MNSNESNAKNLTVESNLSLEKLNDFLCEYGSKVILPIASSACAISNVVNILVLANRQLKGQTYQYLLWKSFFDLLFGVVVLFSWLNFCQDAAQTFIG